MFGGPHARDLLPACSRAAHCCLQLFVRGPRDNMEQLYVKFREKHMLIRAKAFVEKTRRVSYVPRHGCRRRRGGRRMEKKRAYE